MFQLTIKLIFHCVLWDGICGLRNFVYQKDVSEYCRRRAIPSVFLGRRVMQTNAQMLHFSKLDLPYSCFVSVRTQSSNNIIMVIQLSPRSELAESCKEFQNQLIVYEFGETFGGYWGPLPANVVNPNPSTANDDKLYTLRTTQSTTTTKEDTRETDKTTEKTTTTWRPTENDQFITIDVPLVNLSGSLVPGEVPVENSFDIDDTFDLLYDVTPRKGESYDTSILPLIQFSLKRQEENGRRNENGEARYELGYDLGKFTPDYRLTWPVLSTRKIFNRNRNLWKLKKVQKSRVKPHASNPPLFTTESGMFGKSFRKNNSLPTRPQDHEKTEMDDEAVKEKINEDSLNLIEHIMKSLNKSRGLDREEIEQPQNYVQVIRNISDMHHNFSAYLAPWPMYRYLPLSKATVNINNTKKNSYSTLTLSGTTEAITKFSPQMEDTSKYTIRVDEELLSTKEQEHDKKSKQPETGFDDFSIKNVNKTSMNTSITTSLTVEIKLNVTTQNGINTTKYNSSITLGHHTDTLGDTLATKPLSDTTKAITYASTVTSTKSVFGSLVDHESWENVVQSAPVMAVLLNQHAPSESHNLSGSNETVKAAGINRKLGKRHIKSIPIEPARPHARFSSPTPARALSTQVADMQDFAQLVELPDDELSSHVALRFMRQYAGPALYNICDTHESASYKMRHVVLFNTSRIILALGNFSVSRMTVVLTAGETLVSNEAVCAPHSIECQVEGSRVCIDSTSACDGVPNCGAHDIYDEDRLQCGGAMGLQHNVVLAAITFLAVLLTLLYIVHYWLKRCVPKVAGAFFIYTDSAENVLFLDSIMRSPTDVDNVSKFMYPASFFEENINVYEKVKEKTFLQRLCAALSKLNIFKERQKSCELTEAGDLQDLNNTGMRKMYSFTEMEIRQMIGTSKIDEEVQTTESLEIAFLKLINMYKNTVPAQASEAKPPRQKNILQRLELFSPLESHFNEPGPSSRNVASGYRQSTVEDERELHSTVYEPQGAETVLSAAPKTKETCVLEGTVNSKKCLRFEEQATFILPRNNQSSDADAQDEQGQSTARHSVVLGTGLNKLIRRNINSLETIAQDSERTGTDFRSFFTGKKSKKKKNQK